MAWTSFTNQLRDELGELRASAYELLAASRIEYRGHFNRGGGVIFVAPDWAWAQSTDDLRRHQLRVLPAFDRWRDRYLLLFAEAPSELREQVLELLGQIREWLARDGSSGSGWDVPQDVGTALTIAGERFDELGRFLDVLAVPSQSPMVYAIPDTSVLLDRLDFSAYPTLLGVPNVEVVLVSGALTELDALKDQGRNQDVRDRARSAGRAIKELRAQGSLVVGVEIAPGVRVVSRPVEPRFSTLPAILESESPDDRILASALELQRQNSSALVVLVTGDLNLQTKAELMGMPFVDPASPSESRPA